MEQQLIDMVSQRAGISQAQASSAIDAVMNYLKDHPSQIEDLMGGKEGLSNKFGHLFGQ